MSWHREATTISSSAPARSARVAVCRQWVSWSTANPSTTSDSDSSIARTRSATRLWFFIVSVPITIHSSRVETSMRVNEVSSSRRCRHGDILASNGARRHLCSAGQPLEHVGGRGRPVLGQHPGPGFPAVAVGAGGSTDGHPVEQAQRGLEAPEQLTQLGRGGKYSSSTVTGDRCTPWTGSRRSTTASTRASGADAPAVTPTVPDRSSGSSEASLTRTTRGQPKATATCSRATVLDEFSEPMTTTASTWPGQGLEGGLPVGGGEAQVAPVGHPQIGEPLPGPVDDARPTRRG